MRANGTDFAGVADEPSPTRRARAAGAEPAPAAAAPAPAPAAPPPDAAWQTDVPSVDALPIPDYDELSASQVVERLEGLDRESLEAIRRYESEHRGRNTILGKIAQLS